MNSKTAKSFLNYLFLNKSLIENSEIHSFIKGQTIYSEGKTPLGAFLIKEGTVKLEKSGNEGKEPIIRIAFQGELLNYAEVLTNIKFSCTAKALEDCEILFIEKSYFKKEISVSPELSSRLIEIFSNEFCKTENRIADMAFKPIRSRIADVLVQLVKKEDMDSNTAEILSISRKDLARFVGTTEESASRFLSEFKKQNLLSIDQSSIKILDKKKLISIVEQYT